MNQSPDTSITGASSSPAANESRKPQLVDTLITRLGNRAVLLDSVEKLAHEQSARHGRGSAFGVVRPATAEELSWTISQLVSTATHFVTQGAATGLVGAATPTAYGTQWVVSTQRLRDILEIDPVGRTATVAAGYLLSDLNREAERYGLTFPIDLGADPSMGGMVATNTGGSRLIRFGGVRENLLSVEAVLPDPQGSRVGANLALRKNNTGPSWAQLLCGTSGAFGIITSATVRLHPVQRQHATAMVAVPSVSAAIQLVCDMEDAFGEFVSAFEGISSGALNAVSRHIPSIRLPLDPAPDYVVLLELSTAIAPGHGVDLEPMLLAWLESRMDEGSISDAVVDKPARLWQLRHAVSESVQAMGPMVAFDLSVARSRFARFREEAIALIQAMLPGAQACDFGHLGDGGIHLNIIIPPETGLEEVQAMRRAVYDLCVREHAGSFSAEHGVGPFNEGYYARYVEAATRSWAGTLQRHFDPRGLLGNVSLS